MRCSGSQPSRSGIRWLSKVETRCHEQASSPWPVSQGRSSFYVARHASQEQIQRSPVFLQAMIRKFSRSRAEHRQQLTQDRSLDVHSRNLARCAVRRGAHFFILTRQGGFHVSDRTDATTRTGPWCAIVTRSSADPNRKVPALETVCVEPFRSYSQTNERWRGNGQPQRGGGDRSGKKSLGPDGSEPRWCIKMATSKIFCLGI